MAFALLSTLVFEYCWARCATLLGPIASTIGFTFVMLPTCFVIDFVIWPDPQTGVSERYIGGMALVVISFLVVSLVKDPGEPE